MSENKFEKYLNKTNEIGYVNSVDHSIIRVSGLPELKPNERVILEDGKEGIAYNLKEDGAEILMIDDQNLKTKKRVTRTDNFFRIGISPELKGRIIDPLCNPLDNKGPISGEKSYRALENPAPNITERDIVKKPLETGVSKVDLLIPLGYGQRELILGDKKTGKTTFLLQAVTNQAQQGTTCIYVSIGKRSSDVREVENYLEEMGVKDKVIIVRAGAGESSPLLYIAPYSGMSIAEYFRNKGDDVLIVFDDLTTHAKIYRELSLLLKRPPGRSSYPGDVFHIHASLLERAGNVSSEKTTGSITALPVANTLENDISGYIQTNLMAITDGHIFFNNEYFKKGIKPAIDAFLSVSRVGNQTKSPLDQELAQIIRRKMSDYNRALEIARFGVELPEETKRLLDTGEKIDIIFSQSSKTVLSRPFQLLLVGLLLFGYWENNTASEVEDEIENLVQHYKEGDLLDIETEIKRVENLKDFENKIRTLIPQIGRL
ncbi:MAG: F0F1 ATP synthase subunit alpha [Minisyncoccales bacterium]